MGTVAVTNGRPGHASTKARRSRVRRLVASWVALLAAVLPRPVVAAVLHVPSDYPTIEAGLNSAASGDTVEVECGTYVGNIPLHPGVTLRSSSGDPSCVILDGEDQRRIASVVSSPNEPATVVEGVTFYRGRATNLQDNNIGGALRVREGSAVLRRCRFGRSVANGGGAVFCENSSCTFVDCVFDSNSASVGAAVNVSGSSATFQGCVFLRNVALTSGGAIADYSASSIDHCTFAANTAPVEGSSIYVGDPATHITNSIIFGGTGPEPVTCYGSANVEVSCSDVFGNSAGDWVGCLATWGGVAGNFSENPLFCNVDAGDLTLQSSSPCAPQTAGTCGLIGALPAVCGPVSVSSRSWGRIKAGWRDGK